MPRLYHGEMAQPDPMGNILQGIQAGFAIPQAMQENVLRRQTIERQGQLQQREDLQYVNQQMDEIIKTAYLPYLDTSDTERFRQSVLAAKPRLLQEMQRRFGEKVPEQHIAALFGMFDDVQQGQKQNIEHLMQGARRMQEMAGIGPKEPVAGTQEAKDWYRFQEKTKAEFARPKGPVPGTPEALQWEQDKAQVKAAAGLGRRMTPEEAAERATAVKTAEIDVERTRPLSKAEIQNLRHPETLAPARMGMTKGEVEDEGYITVTAAQMSQYNALTNTKAILDEVTTLANKLIKAKTAPESLAQAVKLKTGAEVKSNKDAATYQDAKQSFIGVLSRTMGGEKGVLTDRDINRIDKILPGFRDTVDIKNMKIAILNRIFKQAQDATRRNIFGQPAEQETAALQELISSAEQLINQATGTPAEGGTTGKKFEIISVE